MEIEGTGIPAEKCLHRWSIESPNGPTSIGCCKSCGSKRTFRNSFEYRGVNSKATEAIPKEMLRDIELSLANLDNSVQNDDEDDSTQPKFTLNGRSEIKKQRRSREKETAELTSYTELEREVLRGIGSGNSAKDIQRECKISVNEYNKARNRITHLGGDSLYDAVRRGVRFGIVGVDLQNYNVANLDPEILDLLTHDYGNSELSRVFGVDLFEVGRIVKGHLANLGAKTRYQATAIHEAYIMSMERKSEKL